MHRTSGSGSGLPDIWPFLISSSSGKLQPAG